jgi:hypothetical protein
VTRRLDLHRLRSAFGSDLSSVTSLTMLATIRLAIGSIAASTASCNIDGDSPRLVEQLICKISQ